jgi:hypothetical protein
VGQEAGYNNLGVESACPPSWPCGDNNSFFGYQSGYSNQTGTANAFFGSRAGYSNLGYHVSCTEYECGTENSFFGEDAGYKNYTGSWNSFFGNETGWANTSGFNNSFFGTQAGESNTVESYNTLIGSGADIVAGPDPENFPVSNATAIGYLAKVSQSNSLVLGGTLADSGSYVNVGIGTTAPSSPLHVHRADGTARLLVEETTASTAVRTLFQLANNGAPRFALKNHTSGVEWSFQQSGPGNFLISKEGTGGPEMQVYQTGMVRMGPGGTNNFTLYPNGNLTIAGSLTANGSTFPDYVFEPGYNLMPLPDLRTFIEQKKRLPDIPSAEDVKKQGGHNMTELQLKLLEKIEELTLYTLEQDEELQQVKRENARMKMENAKMRTALAEIRAMLSDR